jgi:predicted HAD superfamily phosphohydrolase
MQYAAPGISVSFFQAQTIAGAVKGMADYQREVLNGTVVGVNLDGSYNVYIRANGTTLYGVPRNDTRSTYAENDNVMLTRNEGNKEAITISGLSGYSSPRAFEEVDIAHT